MRQPEPLPHPPSVAELRALGIRSAELRTVRPAETWWRVHRTQGTHVLRWNEFSHPRTRSEVSIHTRRRSATTPRAVWYGASTPGAALAEAFQADRTIDRARLSPYLTGLRFTRRLRRLDVATDSAGAWATRAGGTSAFSTAPHAITQRWARAIIEAFPELDGIRYNSRFAGSACAALFLPAATAMPIRPVISHPLTHPGLATRIAGVADRLGCAMI